MRTKLNNKPPFIESQKIICSALLALSIGHFAYAQDFSDGVFTYEVQPGDTLYDISDNYIQDPKQWPILANDAKVNDPKHLQPGQVIRIPVNMLRHDKKPLRVTFQRGQAFVSDNGKTIPLQRNMALREGQTITTGNDGFVSLILPDDTLLLISADSVLHIGQFRYIPDVDKTLIDFVLDAGHIESSVMPQPENSRFRVTSPVAVTGVRGTRFGVGVLNNGQLQANDVTQGAVEVKLKNNKGGHQSAVIVDAGEGAMVSGPLGPQVRELLPAPDLSAWPALVHENTWLPPEVKVASASGYTITVAPEKQADEVIFQSRGKLEPIGPLQDGQIYTVTVRALDENAIPGKIAQHRITVKTEPISPILQAPRNLQLVALAKQELICTNVPSINYYLLQVSMEPSFNTLVDQQISKNGCSFVFEPKQNGMYYWRTASLDDNTSNVDKARGRFSAVGQFEVTTQPLPPEIKSEISKGKDIVLQWENTEPGGTYLVEVSNRLDFSKILFSKATSDVMMPLDIKDSCSTLYVRLKTTSAQGVPSEYSKPRALQVTQTWCTPDGVVLLDGQGNPIGSQ